MIPSKLSISSDHRADDGDASMSVICVDPADEGPFLAKLVAAYNMVDDMADALRKAHAALRIANASLTAARSALEDRNAP